MQKLLKLCENIRVPIMSKSYLELIQIQTYEERYEYLKTNSTVCEPTLGSKRYLEQQFYRSKEWRTARRDAIVRDNGYDIGCEEYPINGMIIVHHINPITLDDLLDRSEKLTDLNNLICVSEMTHKAIHYGDAELIQQPLVIRTKKDTCLW